MSFVFFYASLICRAATQKAQEMTHQINLINDSMFVPSSVTEEELIMDEECQRFRGVMMYGDFMSKKTCKHACF